MGESSLAGVVSVSRASAGTVRSYPRVTVEVRRAESEFLAQCLREPVELALRIGNLGRGAHEAGWVAREWGDRHFDAAGDERMVSAVQSVGRDGAGEASPKCRETAA